MPGDSEGVRRGIEDDLSDRVLLGLRGTGVSRTRLLWGALPGSEGHHVVWPVLTTGFQYHSRCHSKGMAPADHWE